MTDCLATRTTSCHALANCCKEFRPHVESHLKKQSLCLDVVIKRPMVVKVFRCQVCEHGQRIVHIMASVLVQGNAWALHHTRLGTPLKHASQHLLHLHKLIPERPQIGGNSSLGKLVDESCLGDSSLGGTITLLHTTTMLSDRCWCHLRASPRSQLNPRSAFYSLAVIQSPLPSAVSCTILSLCIWLTGRNAGCGHHTLKNVRRGNHATRGKTDNLCSNPRYSNGSPRDFSGQAKN